MKIYAKSKHHFDGTEEYNNRLPLTSQVIRLGDYLKNAKDKDTGNSKFMVYKTERIRNSYNLYITIMYQIPLELRKKMKEYGEQLHGVEEDIYTANIFLSIATYQQYIRLNVILLNDMEPTLGFLRLDRNDLMSLPYCKQKFVDFTYKKILKYFEKYDVQI